MSQQWGPPGPPPGPYGYAPPPAPPPPAYGYMPVAMVAYAPQIPAGCVRCPFCGCVGVPVLQKKTTTVGWVIFAVLLLLFFPLCWIGLLIQETRRRCGACRSLLGGQ